VTSWDFLLAIIFFTWHYRQFTPQLEKFYNEMNRKGKKFEIVFVSRDHSNEEFAGYYSKMPVISFHTYFAVVTCPENNNSG